MAFSIGFWDLTSQQREISWKIKKEVVVAQMMFVVHSIRNVLLTQNLTCWFRTLEWVNLISIAYNGCRVKIISVLIVSFPVNLSYLIVKDFWVLQNLKKNIGNYKFVKISKNCRVFLQILWIYSQKLKKNIYNNTLLTFKNKIG